VESAQALREATLGIRVEAGGEVTFVGEGAKGRGAKEGAEGAVIATVGIAAIAGPVWVVEGLAARWAPAKGRRIWRRGIVALIAVAMLIAAFQVVAAARASPLWLLASPLLLLADAAFMRYRATRAE
jgi:hypothetical protein